jgi:hypothetical protein
MVRGSRRGVLLLPTSQVEATTIPHVWTKKAAIAFSVVALMGGCSRDATKAGTTPSKPKTTASGTTSDVPPVTDASGDPVRDTQGNVDADVVVQAFDELRFDKPQYDGKADLTMGLLDQGAGPHTLLIEGRSDFKLAVSRHGEARVADIQLGHGTYTIYCELPGHRAAGMEAKLVIP